MLCVGPNKKKLIHAYGKRMIGRLLLGLPRSCDQSWKVSMILHGYFILMHIPTNGRTPSQAYSRKLLGITFVCLEKPNSDHFKINDKNSKPERREYSRWPSANGATADRRCPSPVVDRKNSRTTKSGRNALAAPTKAARNGVKFLLLWG